MVLNALTVDVEDYFHVSGFESSIPRDTWDDYELRVEASTDRVLALLAEQGVRGTFFVLGWVAERVPELVQRIHRAGHEVASHGYWHRLVYDLAPEDFRADVQRSLDVLQGITGEPVIGYRAPSFSIVPDSRWAVDILQELGLRYDSSIFPALPLLHKRYGDPSSPKAPYQIRPGFTEVPMSTFRVLGRTMPVGGGGWLRHYPLGMTLWGLRQVIREGRPAVVYVHPWELDPDQPRVKGRLKSRLAHYRNLHKTEQRLRALCRKFRFGPVRDLVLDQG